MSSGVCASCSRGIDASAKLCPYCGANPQTGERIDTQAILQELFRPKELTTSESVLEYARQRQGVVVTVSVIVAFLLLAVIHQFVTGRNNSAVSDSPAVPLTEITDVANRPDETAPQPIPALDFQYNGNAQVMRTYIVEPGAATPPEIVAAQQAEALAKAQAAAAAQQAEALSKAQAAAAARPAGAVPPVTVPPGAARPLPAGAARPGVAVQQPQRPAVPQPPPQRR